MGTLNLGANEFIKVLSLTFRRKYTFNHSLLSDIVFPVLDVARMAVRHQKNNEVICTMNNGIIIDKLKIYINESCQVVNNMIVALRTICNLCLHELGENLVFINRFDILENVTSLGQLNKNCQVSVLKCLSQFCCDLTSLHSCSVLIEKFKRISSTSFNISRIFLVNFSNKFYCSCFIRS